MNYAAAPAWLTRYPLLVPFTSLSYPVPTPNTTDSFLNSTYYSTGPLDICFSITFLLVFAVLREFCRLVLLEPFARKWLALRAARKGMSTPQLLSQAKSMENTTAEKSKMGEGEKNIDALTQRKLQKVKLEKITRTRVRGMTKEEWHRERSVLRFAEQGWYFIYYGVYWSFGLYIHLSLPTSPWNLRYLWLAYPHTPLPSQVKFYYLTQAGCWLHQVFILNAEARRKDHYQMLSHHLITIALITWSYFANYTRVGCLILVLMDWCDILLALTKMFRYFSLKMLCDATFVCFLLSWLLTRHVGFLAIIYSAYKEAPTLITFAWKPEEGHFFTQGLYRGFISLLVALQIILCMWFVTILRVTWRVVTGEGAADERSDEEGESPEEEANDADSDEDSALLQPQPTSPRDEPKRKAR